MTWHGPGDISPLWVTPQEPVLAPPVISALPLPVPAQPSDVSQSGWGSGRCPEALGPHWRPLAMSQRARRKFWGALVAQPRWAGVLWGTHPACALLTHRLPNNLWQGSSPKLQGDLWGDERGLPHLPPVWLHPDGTDRHSLGGSRGKAPSCSLGASPG